MSFEVWTDIDDSPVRYVTRGENHISETESPYGMNRKPVRCRKVKPVRYIPTNHTVSEGEKRRNYPVRLKVEHHTVCIARWEPHVRTESPYGMTDRKPVRCMHRRNLQGMRKVKPIRYERACVTKREGRGIEPESEEPPPLVGESAVLYRTVYSLEYCIQKDRTVVV